MQMRAQGHLGSLGSSLCHQPASSPIWRSLQYVKHLKYEKFPLLCLPWTLFLCSLLGA